MGTFFKVVVLGDGGIGKTSICNYLTTGEFFGSYKLSIGADFFSKKIVVDGVEVSLQICDIGGQDQFAEISNIFTKGAHGALICYDTTRRDTLDSLERWISKLEDTSIPKVLVSTKNDVEDLREVLDEEGFETAKRLGIPFYIPTTSLKGIGITETFETISRLMLQQKRGEPLPQTVQQVDVSSPKQPELHPISSSQRIEAQPLGVGRVPTQEGGIQAPVAPPTPDTELVPPSTDTIKPPEIRTTEEAQPSFTEPISLAPQAPVTPPVEQEQYTPPPVEQEQYTPPTPTDSIEPPTEPEKTTTQPISTIPSSVTQEHQQQQQQQTEQPQPKEEKSRFSFLDRLKEERKKYLDDDDE